MMEEKGLNHLGAIEYGELGWMLFTEEAAPARAAVMDIYLMRSDDELLDLLKGRQGKKFSKAASQIIQKIESGHSAVADIDPGDRLALYSRVASADFQVGSTYAQSGMIGRNESHYFLHAAENAALASREYNSRLELDPALTYLDMSVQANERLIANAAARGDADEQLHGYVNLGRDVYVALSPWLDKLLRLSSSDGSAGLPTIKLEDIPPDHFAGYGLDYYHKITPYLLKAAEATARGYNFAIDNDAGRSEKGVRKTARYWGGKVVTNLELLTRNSMLYYMLEVRNHDRQRSEYIDVYLLSRSKHRSDFVDLFLATTIMNSTSILAMINTAIYRQEQGADANSIMSLMGKIDAANEGMDTLLTVTGLEHDPKSLSAGSRGVLRKLLGNDRRETIELIGELFKSFTERDSDHRVRNAMNAAIVKHQIGLQHLEYFAKQKRGRRG